jgi:ketosteroid isomerase-like protein
MLEKTMKALLLALCVGFFGFHTPCVCAQSEPALSSTESQQITDLEQRRAAAVVHRDLAVLDKITAPDSVRILPTGALETKSQLLSELKSGELTYDSINVDEISVRLYGNTAVVTGRSEFNGHRNGKPFTGRCRFSRVWVKESGGWRETLFQLTPISVP